MDLKASFQYPVTDTLLRGDAKIKEKKGVANRNLQNGAKQLPWF